jgi:serine/threonine protein kinase
VGLSEDLSRIYFGQLVGAVVSSISDQPFILPLFIWITRNTSIQREFVIGKITSFFRSVNHPQIIISDLKPENVLLATTGKLKLSDFGLAGLFRYKGQERRLPDRCGSLPYVAPEVRPNVHPISSFHLIDTSSSQLADISTPYRGPPVDCWGLGVILFTFLVGSECFPSPLYVHFTLTAVCFS